MIFNMQNVALIGYEMNKEHDIRPGCDNVKEPGQDVKVCNGCLRRLQCMMHPESHTIWYIEKTMKRAVGKYLGKVNHNTSLLGVQKTLTKMLNRGLISGWSNMKIEQRDNGIVEFNVQVVPVQPVGYVEITVAKFPE